eukprot:746077-Hanusia_phi.AAC.3
MATGEGEGEPSGDTTARGEGASRTVLDLSGGGGKLGGTKRGVRASVSATVAMPLASATRPAPRGLEGVEQCDDDNSRAGVASEGGVLGWEKGGYESKGLESRGSLFA